ncbi:type IV-A pilus assembly ATPase PilB [Legionella anisa]|uniref:Type IV-A pilus assembly ATPase PilB n=1 Tax=Legionella anisa TaxID=28082 RepID=A0AAX0WU43_9GAMM|nr:type IV-A pilus assembly ATPase PilB [Legionella anisa]AWN74295.1 type IV-A pilus assembly ATPase PilB [Legionella anisa]KTC72026.1 pilus assembly protein PilB [Legionella anisa]MBN5934259.1 type IV-A pilus assembly ATPase PilB [Legionella anisa]MCW8425669.1 type IV-A pilus assembly ATPase PilB [Legionella anisa]MCW8448902.1 type IV-A pilus assembly ATPase PilB [Legionella anisa]
MLGSNEFKLHGMGQLFVLEKLLDKTQAVEFCKNASAEKMSLVQYLVKNNILSATQIALTAAHNFGAPMLDLDSIDIDAIPVSLVNEKLIRRHSMVPLFYRGNNLYLATEDPSKQVSLKEIQFHTGLNTHAIIVEADKLSTLIDHLLTVQETQGLSEFVGDATEFDGIIINEEEEHETSIVTSITEDAPIVKFVNKILLDAIKQGASDIHFEPYEKEYRIRYRQDGILHEIATPPGSLSTRITARIKIMSNLDISERRIPQDGGFKMKISKTRSIDFRVSTCPTTSGEKVVMRILDPGSAKLGIEALGFSPIQKENFVHSIERPQGMILVTGPTGSGKTVTLYTALNILNTKEVNISTAEDPVEIKVPGINQVNINPKAGLTFSNALRAFLRQDPDIIMVGEIRDLETAEIAVKAAQTGHLVLSTLHTNSSAETLNRLVNMGIATFNVASSVTLIIAQRLARKLCEHCKVLRDDFNKPGLLELGFSETDLEGIKLYKAGGCAKCTNGYRGRIGLFEVLPMTKKLGQIIMSGGNSLDILRIAQEEGMITIYQSGLEKVKQGITTIEEVNRVTVD